VSTADATIARGPRAALARARSVRLAVTVPRAALGLAFLVGLSLALRTQAIHARFWIDEGLSVGIASHPFHTIPGVLDQDGSPPLYYLLLNVWMHVFGSGEADTHALSVACILATIPIAWAAGRTVYGARAAWIAALLAAINPFMTFYAQETRMYALVIALSTAVTGLFVVAFVHGQRRWLPLFSVALALLIYAHNWGLFLAVGTVAALVGAWWTSADRRALLRDAALAYGAVGLVYLPWIPTLLSQAKHTGAPWASRPRLHDILNGLTALLGGPPAAMAFALGAGFGLATLLAAPRRSERARATVAVATIGAVALALAWLASQASPAWATRYFALFLGPLLLLGAAGLARAGRLGIVVVAILALFWFNPRTGALMTKSNAHTTAVLVRDRLEDGDLVVATHPEQGPLMHYYLPHDVRLRWANAIGPVADPGMFDWRDALERLEAAKPTPTADLLISTLKPGQKLLLIQPIVRSAHWRAPWTKLVRKRAAQWERVLDRDPRLSRTLAAPVLKHRRLPRGVRAVLYERLAPGAAPTPAADAGSVPRPG
jgi:mannosyltransferase